MTLPDPTPTEQRLIDQLSVDFAALGPVSSAAHPHWAEIAEELRCLVSMFDPREFLRWEVVARTMGSLGATYTKRELSILQSLPDWETCWKPALTDDPVGCPMPCADYPESSGPRIHHCYTLALFEKATGCDLTRLGGVAEFGGGWGDTARLIHRLGFRGDYVIYDLPESSALQRYYLGSLGVPARCVTNLDYLNDFAYTNNNLFVATWSLSESPIELRERVLLHMGAFDWFLIAYKDQLFELDNSAYFERWQAALPGVEWTTAPFVDKNTFLFGRRQ